MRTIQESAKTSGQRDLRCSGGGESIEGITNLRFTVDGHLLTLPVKAVPSLKYDLILGVDLEKKFKVDTTWDGKWRVFNGKFHKFTTSKNVTNGTLSSPDLAEVNSEQREMIEKLLDKFLPKESENAPGLTPLTQHRIDVQGAEPIKQRMRRVSPALIDEMHSQVDRMIEQDIIEPSNSPWNSPPVMVKK